ncbi:HNH endonuclease [Cecembia lonarensis]|uniref:HNH nuclease domain-containing protein n=1 Tax=Cecembia lonarensis (strain CCUG 58316 / KCTC 22772 / LW9) TaxID=1225176 RepID=K1L461_CECL9|nr:HNH endonuclease [Cecembia lonarensis]EKB49596.1 hypothetical protein B879_01800 [Cecembia lonarensis LW9]
MDVVLSKYLKIFKKLRIDRSKGSAPHKPILLLSLLQTFQQGINFEKKIYISPELVSLFKTNWSLLVKSNHDCRFALPFYHLSGDKFWKLVPKQGFENILLFPNSMKTFSNLNMVIECAIIDQDLVDLMTNPESNIMLQQFILQEYFPDTKDEFVDSLFVQKKHFDTLENKIFNESSENYREEIKKLILEKNDEEIFLRGSIFKREIPKIYDNTCCISGMKIDATLDISMIDACHVVPFSESYNDTVVNGIALCPNLHRAFDRGLIGIDDNYKVIVSKSFVESESNYSIKDFEGQEIRLPKLIEYYPLKENILWHRDNVFKN